MGELLGNEVLRSKLAGMSEANRLHHCLLFEGPDGVGKSATALWLAQLINCTAPSMFGPRTEPCGACWSCRAITDGQHPDIIVVGLDPERTAPIISVRQARDVISKMSLRPYSAKRRMVIIDPADAMGTQSANALLKTFEEPPRDTGFILVCPSARRLLPTVRSRSQRIRFRPVERERLTTWLRLRGVEQPQWIAGLSDGCPGRALALAGGEAEEWRESRDALLEVLAGSMQGVFSYTDKLTRGDRATWTVRADLMLDALARMVRDALVITGGGREEVLYNADLVGKVRSWSSALGVAGSERISQAIDHARQELAAYVNGRLLFDALLSAVMAELGSARRA
ncbi:MAG: DNA polymerase-3 subunit delta' [Myxococcota bacterium]|jgi:DNA polymerase-3 subunit delta'